MLFFPILHSHADPQGDTCKWSYDLTVKNCNSGLGTPTECKMAFQQYLPGTICGKYNLIGSEKRSKPNVCQPVRSLAANNELHCTKSGEQEYGYCVAQSTDSSRLDFYYSAIFVTTWPGTVNGNNMHDAENEDSFAQKIKENFDANVDVDCRYKVTQGSAISARDAKKESVAEQASASHVAFENNQTILAP